MKNTDVFLLLDDFIYKIRMGNINYQYQIIRKNIKKY